jgi:hypothetical protein
MSGFRDPYDPNIDLSASCSCGRHANQHEYAAGADAFARTRGPEILSQSFVESRWCVHCSRTMRRAAAKPDVIGIRD